MAPHAAHRDQASSDLAGTEPATLTEASREQAFRDQVRAFLAEALTSDLRAAGRATIGTHSEFEAGRIWHQRLYRQGWVAPAWPREHGGTGWSARQRLIFDQECAAHDAPMLFAGGIRNVGPLLIAEGTPAQQAHYLPRILRGDDFWCQGYSEVGAGSDLARLRTRAERDGDDYVINGTKLWTTGANHANRMFGLVRTRADGKPQAGITFLLIDMSAPGISVRPVQTIHGEAEFNEVYFDSVRVPAANRVGEEDDGWRVAKQLMVYARASNTTCSLLQRTLRRLHEALQRAPAGARADVGGRLVEVEMRLAAIERLEYAASHEGAAARAHHASLMKLQATELHQAMTEVLLELAGHGALEQWQQLEQLQDSSGPFASAKYLGTRAASIYSGTNEVHRNLLARQLLGDFA